MRGLPCKFNCGDHVYDRCDPRHVGRIVQINSGIWAIIQWANGWYSEAKVNNLEKADGEENNDD